MEACFLELIGGGEMGSAKFQKLLRVFKNLCWHDDCGWETKHKDRIKLIAAVCNDCNETL